VIALTPEAEIQVDRLIVHFESKAWVEADGGTGM
jgi:hypothetical protein